MASKRRRTGVIHKRGALSTADMDFIRDNVDEMSTGQMASILNRNEAPVIRYIKRLKLGKKYKMAREMGDKTEKMILEELKSKPFYKVLRKQMSVEELDYFHEQWVSILKQFNGDLFPSEELELKEFLLLEVLKNRTLTDKREWLEERESLKKELNRMLKLPIEDQDESHAKFLRQEISAASSHSNDCVRAFRDLSDKSDKIRHALKASREQRLKQIESQKTNFAEWLRQLTDPSIRAAISREMEIMRVATEKEKVRLGTLYEYPNKDVDLPVLNSENIKKVKDKK